jgi:hypothetical protein
MNQHQNMPRRRVRSFLWIFGALATLALGVNAWAANDLDTPTTLKEDNGNGDGNSLRGADTFNAKWLGHNDLQGRVTYQTTVHTYPDGRVIAFAGHFNANPPMLNPLTGKLEKNGTSLVDVTDPRQPVYLQHIPADKGGARMNMLCDGSVLPHGTARHVYLLRENGAVSHEVWDVTDPVHSTLVSIPVQGLNVTHRSWWDCRTGIAYIVGGATQPGGDGWTGNSSPNQHLKIFDLSDPAHPDRIMDFGYPGQNPGSTFVIPGTENTTKTVPPGVHGPIVVSTLNGNAVANGRPINRLYMPYGVGSDGIFQIVDLTKMLPPTTMSGKVYVGAGTGHYVDPLRPTDAELLQGQIGVIYMPGVEGGHSSMPYYGIPLTQYANFTDNNVRDILGLASEETDNRCTGSPHLLYLLDITQKIGQGGSTSAEQHPWPISTVTVNDFSERPNFCSRGTRFGVHSMNENFNDPYYGKLMVSAWFDAGIRVTDIRDPYHPAEVAFFIAPVNANTQPSTSTINGQPFTAKDISCDNTYVDDDGLLYCGDRVGSGLDIVQLTGQAAKIGGVKGNRRNPNPGGD